MLPVSILEDSDTIQATDWCRPLQLITMSGGHSDYYSFTSCYSGTPENNTKWLAVYQKLGAVWLGRTVGEYNTAVEECGPQYEFLRGDIPVSHQYGLTKPEMLANEEEHLNTVFASVGKYKGKTWAYIKANDISYFEWADRAHLVPSLYN